MKAILFTKYGSVDFLKLKDIEKPAPTENQVLVKIRAASINSWDWELLKGTPFINRLMFGVLRPKKINILGCDIAGQVEAVGENVEHFKIGDEVFGDLSGSGWGGFAEYVCTEADALTVKPAGMTFEQAASIPQAGLLALQAVREHEHILPGQKVLINGAGGGVGSFAIQIAKSLGAEVTGVDSTDKIETMRLLGADHTVDYTRKDFTRNGLIYDLIIDVAAHHSVSDYRRTLSSNGRYVMVGGSSGLVNRLLVSGLLQSLLRWPLRILGISKTGGKKMGLLLHKPNKGLDYINELFEAGKVVPLIDQRYSLAEVANAIRYFGEGHAKGKIVITYED